MSGPYRVITKRDAIALGLRERSKWEDEFGGVLVLFDGATPDAKPVRVVAEDGGEPEDQTFGRDWSWVDGELNDAFRRGAESMREAAAKAVDGRRKSLAEATDSARWEWVREGSDTWLELGNAARTVESLPLDPPHRFGPLIDGAPTKKLTQEDIDRVLGAPSRRWGTGGRAWCAEGRELVLYPTGNWERKSLAGMDSVRGETVSDLERERDWLRGGT